MPQYLLVGFILFLASLAEGFLGFGSSLLATPFLTLIIGVKTTTPLIAMTTIVVSIIVFFRMQQYFSLHRLFYLIIGSLIGVPIGVYLLKIMNEASLKKF